MTTSGVTTNNPVSDTIIKKALRLVHAYSPLHVPLGNQITDAEEALNMMIKAWQIRGFMWVRQFATLFLVPGQRVYDLPGANGATSYVQTDLTANLAALDVVIPVTDTTGMTVGDIVGIYLSSGSLHWDVILSVDTATQITITTGVPSAATSGAVVYTYSSSNALYRPTRIFTAQRKNNSGSDIPMNPYSREDYAEQVNKENNGTPIAYYYDPQLTTGQLYIWQPPTDASYRLVLDIDRPLQVMVDSANTFDFPEEWAECIAYGLALRLAPEYSLPMDERRELKNDFIGLATNLLDYNKDWVPLDFGVTNHG